MPRLGLGLDLGRALGGWLGLVNSGLAWVARFRAGCGTRIGTGFGTDFSTGFGTNPSTRIGTRTGTNFRARHNARLRARCQPRIQVLARAPFVGPYSGDQCRPSIQVADLIARFMPRLHAQLPVPGSRPDFMPWLNAESREPVLRKPRRQAQRAGLRVGS